MATIDTARGALDVADLGTTLMHEHVFVLTPDMIHDDPGWWDEQAETANAVARLVELVDHGVDTIVDLTVLGLGRNVRRIQKVVEQTRCHVVLATGYYTYNELPFAFKFRPQGTGANGGDPLADMFIRDLTEEIPGTGVRATVLKCATDHDGVTPGVERVLRAVATAHRQTGAPISTHTNALARQGLEQIRVFKEEGVDLERVVIGHSGDTTDLDYLEQMLADGVTLGMDRFGLDLLPHVDRVATVAALCEKGYAAQMVLSHDAYCFGDWSDMQGQRAAAPNWHYLFIPQVVVPDLLDAGVSQEQIDQMMVANPARILAPVT